MYYAGFTVCYELLHGPMYRHPSGVDGLDEGLILLVWDEDGDVPSCATVQHMEDYVFVHKDEITFHLLIEGISHFGAASVAGTGF